MKKPVFNPQFWAKVTPADVIEMEIGVCDATLYGFPLHWAAQYSKDYKVIDALLARGANIHERDKGLAVPLHWVAIENKERSVMNALLKAGKEVDIRDDIGFTPLHFAAMGNNENLEAIAFLLDEDAEINARSKDGIAPLHRAASDENLGAIDYLLKRGANINVVDNWDRTPLHYVAQYHQHLSVMKHLLKRGANANLQDKKGDTPFDTAEKNFHLRKTYKKELQSLRIKYS